MTALYAHVQSGVVIEDPISPPWPIAGMFPAGMVWVLIPDGVPVARGWTYDGTAFHRPGPAPPPPLDQALAALDAARIARQADGVMFKPAGAGAPILFPTDPASITTIQGALMGIQLGIWHDGEQWKTAAGTRVPFLAADVEGLAAAAFARFRACFAHEGVLDAQVRADTTTDITQGWPPP